ncbi:hypothetical protein ADILRU_0149 [Leifsonia rubra CMS 76R]|nr:hypothetical protein ADILRU_0149 [Leifsonia rubra CMS 76R]
MLPSAGQPFAFGGASELFTMSRSSIIQLMSPTAALIEA